ncbi:MAG: hypothetical protein WEF86_10150 [Gemmatimonadota bacterium]
MIGLSATAVSCSASDVGVPQAQVSDSASLRIVSYELGSATIPVYRVVQDHDLEIGAREGAAEYTFSRIVDLALTPDDGLVVSDGDSHELRVFGGDGRHQATIGRRGDGPGEFAGAPLVAGVSGDTVFTYDVRSGRTTSFLLNGGLIETIALRSGTGNRITSLHRLTDGSYWAVSPWIAAGRVTEVHDARLEVDSIVIERLSETGGVLDTVKVMADRSRLRIVQDGGAGRLSVIQADPPYLPQALLESNRILVVAGRSDSFELELTAASGDRTLLRVRGVDHPADADDIRRRQEAQIREDLGGRPPDPRTRQLLLDYLPHRLPAFAAVRISEHGDVWVARSDFDDSSGYDWLVFAPTGELRGSVRTPPGIRLLAIRPHFIVGVATDDFDVPYIRRYPLAAPNEH